MPARASARALCGSSGLGRQFGAVAACVRKGRIAHVQADVHQAAFHPAPVPEQIYSAFAAEFPKASVSKVPEFLPDVVMKKIDGTEHRFADFKGTPTLVNLWATWCTPCIVELPSLQKLSEHYKGRMNVIAVSVDQGRDLAAISGFLEKRMVGDFAGYLDITGGFIGNPNISGIPTSFLIGSDGLILYRFEGDADWTSETARAFFDSFLSTSQ
ncbi:MAG: hypothetical protein DI626_08410 [Micavibrio aeruginosavorus]|uniref:Thioredoxin domain-containing protein n=1 Tax=Micavibrio aeruginosavorus TaxID=349221 RepID=A0A2W4ZPF9_9BACT|nr:MAG: hypothetical protein DI626_08410 [Micavibrio aeruginosavorus]